jgi:hypothetical protein
VGVLGTLAVCGVLAFHGELHVTSDSSLSGGGVRGVRTQKPVMGESRAERVAAHLRVAEEQVEMEAKILDAALAANPSDDPLAKENRVVGLYKSNPVVTHSF